MGGTEDADPEAPCEEGDIGDEDDRVWGIVIFLVRCVPYALPYLFSALCILFRQLTDRLPPIDVFLPKSTF
ncbi:MAG TPA: hypothetical protein DDW17_08145 [Deltaproteobacteria bacterium]|nr:hypothetical protein [Deltaproteobacteria bacterium]